MTHSVEIMEQLEKGRFREGSFSQALGGVELELYLRVLPESRVLFVFFESAWKSRDIYKDYMPGSCLFIRDPLQDEEAPGSAWYLGPEGDLLPDIIDLLEKIGASLNIPRNKIITWGSGEDAFTAIRLASAMGGIACALNPPLVLEADNPQKYHHCLNCIFQSDEKRLADIASVRRILGKGKDCRALIGLNQNEIYDSEYLREMEALKKISPVVRSMEYSVHDTDEEIQAFLPEIMSLAGLETPKVKYEKIGTGKIYLLLNARQTPNKNKILFMPSGRSDLEDIEIQLPFDWNDNPFNDSNWQAQLQMWRFLDPNILQYEKTWDRGWLANMVTAIQDWYAYYLSNRPGPSVWKDMIVGVRAMKIAWILAAHYSGYIKFGTYFVSICEKMRDQHLDFLLDEKNIAFTNHSYMDLHGLMALAKTLPVLKAKAVERFARNAMVELMDRQFSEEGVHMENSPSYQAFSINRVRNIMATGWFDDPRLERIIGNAKKILSLMYMPDGRLAPIGDTDGNAFAEDKFIFDAPSAGELNSHSGYVIVRAKKGENKSYLFVMGAFNAQFHKHSDDLSVLWYENCEILCDPGKYAYGKTAERDYFISTRAHNTLEIDGKNTHDFSDNDKFIKYGSKIISAYEKDAFFIITGEIDFKKFGVTHRRIYLYKPADFLLIVDNIQAAVEHGYSLYWHFAPEIKGFEKKEDGWLGELPYGKKLYIKSFADASYEERWISGQTEPRIEAFISRSYRTMEADKCLKINFESKNFQMITAMSLDRAVELFIKDNNKIKLRHLDKTYCLDIQSSKLEREKR